MMRNLTTTIVLLTTFATAAEGLPALFPVNGVPRNVAPSQAQVRAWARRDDTPRVKAQADFVRPIVAGQAARSVDTWPEKAKVTTPRTWFANLLLGERIAAVNAAICAAEPWSGEGSDWLFHSGDYDVGAQPGTWVITRVNGRAVARDYDAWPSGWQSLPGASFLCAGLLTPEGQCELRRDSRRDR